MSLPVNVRPAAKAEFDAAADWYEDRKPGLGQKFIRAVESTLDLIAAQPESNPTVFQQVRMALVAKYPYCIHYLVETGRIEVLSVFHTARDPSVWKRRV